MNVSSHIKTLFYLGLTLICQSLKSQNTSAVSYFDKGEKLRKSYEFSLSKEAYARAISVSDDSVLTAMAKKQSILCDNGLTLSKYIARPNVIASLTVSEKDFFLYYDLCPSGSWIYPPRTLLVHVNDSGNKRYPAFYRSDANMLVFSAKDTLSGTGWDLYFIRKKSAETDSVTVWEAPQKPGPGINSDGNELFPTLSRDGKTLYFCSNGLFGLGGYSLYMSQWNEEAQSWNPAENMGIPFSSPADDMLYMLADDSRYFYFVSNRNTSPDSLILYKVEHESSPVKVTPSSVDELREIASLRTPVLRNTAHTGEVLQPTEGPLPDSALVDSREASAHYASLVQSIRKLLDEIGSHEKKLADYRAQYNELSREEDRMALSNIIQEEELALMDLQESLIHTQKAAQNIETQFLSYGVLPPAVPGKVNNRISENTEKTDIFNPSRQSVTSVDHHIFEAPVPVIPPVDMTFRFEKESVIVPWENEPMSLYYRLQLFTVSQKVPLRQLKGISPVFEVKSGSRYVYYAGQFTSYSQASQALTTARRKGFPGAIVVAYYERKSIPVQTARKRESEKRTAPEMIVSYRIFLASDELPADMIREVGALTSKDIVKEIRDSKVEFFIGPFSNHTEAGNLAQALRDRGFTQVIVQTVNN